MSSADGTHNITTALPETTSKSCQKCRRVLKAENFAVVKSGKTKGQRSGTCQGCSAKKAEYQKARRKRLREAEKESTIQEPDELGTLALDEFLDALALQNDKLDLDAEVDLSDIWGHNQCDLRKVADQLARLCWDRMNYRWLYHSNYDVRGGMRYQYHCAQSRQRIKKPKKNAPPEKQRNKLSMLSFECHGWLFITLTPGMKIAHIKIKHQDGHVPYCPIDIPPDVDHSDSDMKSSDCDEQLAIVRQKALTYRQAADILESQLPHRNPIWMKSMAETNMLTTDLEELVQDVHLLESSGHERDVILPQTAREHRRSRNTMGYQVRVPRTRPRGDED
ncbi:hypothetical protein NEOLEDRAFT_1146613 [Neolentinus lepideus HHB14362 ss-1]|uniref:Uncharacterized protein n=1 Tax=Neolentinus lepideus HHB14362 ss-1 TaxID=1314782 RepID=A0A165U006_9AGAM|nr:hypothetical protein NEOLEDRAFT_1146613 [Neolentinus lepideus HHB14362 ss-1]